LCCPFLCIISDVKNFIGGGKLKHIEGFGFSEMKEDEEYEEEDSDE
jgi:hypothetical protein